MGKQKRDATNKHEAMDAVSDNPELSEKETVDSLKFNCKDCDLKCATEKGLRTHTWMKHINSQLDGASGDFLLDTEPHDSNMKLSK